jgi:hypothetical protein
MIILRAPFPFIVLELTSRPRQAPDLGVGRVACASFYMETCTCNFRSRLWKVFINAALSRQTCRLGAAIAWAFYARRIAPLNRTPERSSRRIRLP